MVHRTHWRYALCLFYVVLSVTNAADIPPTEETQGIQLMHHSLESPAVLNDKDWDVGGSAGLLGHHLILSDGNIHHPGYLWGKLPIVTNTFDVEFNVQVESRPDEEKDSNTIPPPNSIQSGFAIWFSPEPLAAMKAAHYSETEWNLFGHFNQFSGLGVFFKLYDRVNKFNPSISAVYSDGRRSWNVATDIPTNFGVYWQVLGGNEAMTFKLSVGPTAVTGQAKLVGHSKWTDTFKLNATLPVKGYLGFSGTAAVNIWDIRTYNRNMEFVGQELTNESQEVVTKVKKASGNSELKDSLKIISTMMTKMVSEILPRQDEIARGLRLIEERLLNLNEDVEHILRHLGPNAPPHPHHEDIKSISSQMNKLKQMFDDQSKSFKDHSQSHAKATETLIEAGKSLHERGELAQDRHLENIQWHLTKQQRVNWFLFMVLTGSVLCVLGFVWSRTKENKKNHLF